MPGEANDLAQALAGRAHALARELLPHGRREGQYWVCGSVRGDKGQSCKMHLSGARAGRWRDYAGTEGGDALHLVAAVLYGGNIGEAMRWARAWLGLPVSGPVPGARRQIPAADAKPEIDKDVEERRAAARRIWFGSAAELLGTPVDHYLTGRGIALSSLSRLPGALRFHADLWNRESRRAWPAMLAAISAPSGQMIAIHRTWLAWDRTRECWGKAPLQTPKMTFGSYAGGTIRLQRGSSGKPLAQAVDGEHVVIAEGIETSLSVALACPDLRVLSAVSLSNMSLVELPVAVRHVILAADNDEGNEAARHALEAAAERFMRGGRSVRIAMPQVAGADWNDVLTGVAA